MALFNIPKRNTLSTQAILKKTQEIQQPKIKLKSGTLINKLASIEAQVKASLGDIVDKYLYIDSDEKWLEYCKKACYANYVAIDTETSNLDNMLAELAGVCIMSDNQESAYVPVGHISNITEQILPNQVSKEAIGRGLQMLIDHNAKFIFHNAYFDIIELYQQCGVKLTAYFDTLICSALLDENDQHGLKHIYNKYVMEGKSGEHQFSELFEGIPITHINPKIAGVYGQNDALITMAIMKWFLPYVTKGTPECSEYKLEKIADLFWNMDMPMVDVLVDMKLKGIEFDFEQASKLKEKYTKLKEEALVKFNNSTMQYEDDIKKYNAFHTNDQIELPVNYNSPKQLKALFYDIAGVPVGLYKKSPTGTGKDVVDAILHTESLKKLPIYEVVENLNTVKMYDKAIGTFIDKLTDDAKIHNGKIHCNMILTATDTGRLACREPKQDWAYVA